MVVEVNLKGKPMNLWYKELLYRMKNYGADLIGVADLSGIHELKTGISVAVAISPDTILSIHNGPTMEYYNEYCRINAQLDEIVLFGTKYLIDNGYKAYAQTTDAVKEYGNYRTILPHKTVATRAGIGWIGKSALLVTESYGTAVRISSIVTDADLPYDEPVDISRCGNCTNCKNNCPGNAITGELWTVNKDRDDFFNPIKCRKAARSLSADKINKEISLCGKCIEVCPYTQRYVSRSVNNK